jgi:3D (Asp-Asp-Asp) domain-containing protein
MLETILILGALASPIPNEPYPPTYFAEQRLDDKEYVGEYELTAYIATGKPCADGKYPRAGVTVASNDANLWHKCVYIEGYGVFYVHDRGGMSNNVIDVFVDSYDEAIQFGRRKAEVYVID